MQRDGPAFALVIDLNLQAENVPELSLKRVEIGVDDRCRVARAGSSDVGARAWPSLFLARPFFGLPHRETLGDDLACELLGVIGRGDSPGMAHTDIASH